VSSPQDLLFILKHHTNISWSDVWIPESYESWQPW